jgi:hypothetical protein
MANIGTIIIGQSLNRDSRLSLFINIGFNIVACLPFFLVRVVVFGLIMPFLSYLINFWAFSSLIYMSSSYFSIIETYILRAAT